MSAQEAKLDLICRKAGLLKCGHAHPRHRLGLGRLPALRRRALRRRRRRAGLTVSREQAEYANANRGNLPVETRLEDYLLSIDGKFDRIISIGMFEHVLG